jgi:hypothetical protein
MVARARAADGAGLPTVFPMTTSASSPRSPALLEALPELREIMDRSGTFQRIAERARLVIDGRIHYLVRGDTLGDLEELFVDALSRGSSPEGSDPLSRALFLELTPRLQQAVCHRVA